MPSFLTDIIPGSARKWFYAVYAIVAVGFGAATVWYGLGNQPEWLVSASAVWLFIGGAFGLTAGANVNDPAPRHAAE
jgi:hypothetical protein